LIDKFILRRIIMPPRVGSQTRVAQVTTPRTTRIAQTQSGQQQRPQSVRSNSANARRGELANYGSQRRQQIQRNAETVGNVISNTAKGIEMDRVLPQRFRLEPARGATVTGIRDTQAGKVRGTPPKPVGDWVIRADNAHKGTNYPHINRNPQITKVPDPHTPISPRTLNGLGRTARVLNVAGKIARPVAIAVDAGRLANAYSQDGNRIGRNTIRTGGSIAGGWGGAAAGAWGGAKAGAVIGTFVGGPVGTAVGGLIGGIVGGIGGAFLGSWAGESAANHATR
jgi:hypothetical protein